MIFLFNINFQKLYFKNIYLKNFIGSYKIEWICFIQKTHYVNVKTKELQIQSHKISLEYFK